MAIDPQLLERLVCPVDRTPLEVIPIPEPVRSRLVERYREHFKDEEPEIVEGLASAAGRVYPVVSGIPVLLAEEALRRDELTG